MEKITICALYKFVALPDYLEIREPLLEVCQKNKIFGSLLLASEGINGTIAGSQPGIEAVIAHLKSDPRMADLETKESYHEQMPFYRMKVKLKKEIVTFGVDGTDPLERVGDYVQAEDWNALISDPEVFLVDTRNDYEVKMGTFQGAVDPDIKHFRDFRAYVDQQMAAQKKTKVAMFCTGGIRCERASSYLLNQGFDKVYHLKGGILKYLEKVPEAESMWQGECFVFDERVGLKHDLQRGDYTLCRACRMPLSPEDRQSEFYERGACCPHCHETQNEAKRAGCRERQKQVDLAIERKEAHIGHTLVRDKAE